MTDRSIDVSTEKDQIKHSLKKQYECVTEGTGKANSSLITMEIKISWKNRIQ